MLEETEYTVVWYSIISSVVMSLRAQVTIENKTMVYNQLIWNFYINYLINHTTNYSVISENAFLWKQVLL